MYKKISATLMATTVATSIFTMPAQAHIMNADNIYTDIALSDSREAILYTHAIHLITTDSALYKPAEELSRKDFALWYSDFKGLKGKEAQLVKQAIADGIISSEDGTITYDELNQALFNGEIKVSNGSAKLSRGDYASFVAAHAGQLLQDKTSLLQQEKMETGPTGEIEQVKRLKDESYELQVDGETFSLAEHPSVVNDSTDPLVWEGQQVTQSLVTEHTTADRVGEGSTSDEAKLQYLIIESASAEREVQQAKTATEQGEDSVDEEQVKMSKIWLVVASAMIIVGLVAAMFYRKNKKR
ncbi:MAG: hypothetical protein KBT36_03340 [Kurthia sp.]|nr:hypothetical protein [Candidatus Kurthia equi]